MDLNEKEIQLNNEGDIDANIAYYCLHKFHILPSQYIELDEQEKAFLIAAIEIKLENDRKREKGAKSKVRRKR